MQPVKPTEIDVALVENVVRAGFHQQGVEGVDLVVLAIGNSDKYRHLDLEVHEGVQLDGGLVAAELRPGEKLQAQVDGGGIHGINVGFQMLQFGIHGQFSPRCGNHAQSDVAEDAVVARLVGVGQRTSRDGSPEATVITQGPQRLEAQGRLSQTREAGKLRIDHGQQLVHAGQRTHPAVAAIAHHGRLEGSPWKQFHQLGEERSSVRHGPCPCQAKNRPAWRKSAETSGMDLESCTPSYDQELPMIAA